MMTVKTVAPDWQANDQIIAGLEPTAEQLDLFLKEQARHFDEALADFDNFAHKNGIGQQ